MPFLSVNRHRLSASTLSRYNLRHALHMLHQKDNKPTLSFEELGVDHHVLKGVRRAFPHVEMPTPLQSNFIPAVLEGRDVLIKDNTGTGKSFGLLLALLSKSRSTRQTTPRYWHQRAQQQIVEKPAISSWLVVPHNDLAHQFIHWIRLMKLTREPEQVAQTLLRDGRQTDYQSQIQRIIKDPPHILVTTPKALDECWKHNKTELGIESLQAIVLEEADSLLGIPSNDTPKDVARRMRKHPPPLRKVLDKLFRLRPKVRPPKKVLKDKYAVKPLADQVDWPLQLVLSSATLKPAIQKFLFTESHWVDRGKDAVKSFEGSQAFDPRATTIRHCAVYVDVNGGIRNVVRPEDDEEELEGGDPRLKGMSRAIEVELDEEVEGMEEPGEEMHVEPGLASSLDPTTLLWGGKTLPPQLIDAVASTFALDVPFQALLILPNPVSAAKISEAFQELEIKAVHLDSYLTTQDGAKLLQPFSATSYKKHKEKLQSGDELEREDSAAVLGPLSNSPTLIVANQTAVRGIDLPAASHVFIVGVPEEPVDYLHFSGRVGRLGAIGGEREKTVISFLPEPILNKYGRVKKGKRENEMSKQMKKIWAMAQIKPVPYEHAG